MVLMCIHRTEVLTQVFSDPFTVYSAKTYPGMKGTFMNIDLVK
jgi:hypothetical protein